MPRQHPDPRMSVPISMAVYHQLLGGPSHTDFDKEYWENAAEAIDEWARRHNPDSFAMPAIRGYQWKALFLPDGTVLRTIFGGTNHHCLVEGDRILYNGKPVSPSGFVNAVGGIRRNAWRCTWILLPDTKTWQLADTLRPPARSRPARKPKPAPATQPTAERPPVTTVPAASAVPAPTPRRTEGTAAVRDHVPRNSAIADRRKCATGVSLREDLLQLLELIDSATPPIVPAHARTTFRPILLRSSRVWRRALQARSRSVRPGP